MYIHFFSIHSQKERPTYLLAASIIKEGAFGFTIQQEFNEQGQLIVLELYS